jgi:hypothetical protein
MKPISEAVKRVYRWRIGVEFAGTEAELWDWFNNWSGRNADGSLTYKTMLYEKLEEVANELKHSLAEAEKLPEKWRKDHEFAEQISYYDVCADELESALRGEVEEYE